MGYEKLDLSATNQKLLEENFALKQRIQELERSECNTKNF